MHRTPLLKLPWLGPYGRAACVQAKFETRQIMGSFKSRGAIVRLSAKDVAQYQGVVAASAGNHGLGVAWASRVLNIPATIVVPQNVAENKRMRIDELASLVLAPYPGYDETERYARALAKSGRSLFVSAFDDPLVAAANGATLAREILEEMPRCDAIICPIGGGGLASGIARYLEFAGHPAKLIAVQSKQTNAMSESLRLGRALLSQAPKPTLAEGLEGGVSPRTFELVRKRVEQLIEVSEDSIGRAMALLFQEMGEVVEGSAAVCVAAILEQRLPDSFEAPCLVLTGRNVDARVLDAQLALHLGPAKPKSEGGA
ncbi:MAG: pyridoxal-phosphate dependent enzyme [Myxococcota bacterium]|jgi:threonine dehydratase|nr:pyridoxal-phosphate dependent enzyme [Myxococcota bacterium]